MSFSTEEKPIKMPENYDFTTRNVDFKKYEKYFILRTDAVWEKFKLLSMFYSTYKAQRIHVKGNIYYEVSDEWAMERMNDADPSGVHDLIAAKDDIVHRSTPFSAGQIWQWDNSPKFHNPLKTSHFLGDKSKDGTFLCMLKFHKFMRCNEKSSVKLVEASIFNGTWSDYKCLEELNELHEICIIYHLKILFEMYHYRVYNNYFKPVSQQRIYRGPDIFTEPLSSKKLYY